MNSDENYVSKKFAISAIAITLCISVLIILGVTYYMSKSSNASTASNAVVNDSKLIDPPKETDSNQKAAETSKKTETTTQTPAANTPSQPATPMKADPGAKASAVSTSKTSNLNITYTPGDGSQAEKAALKANNNAEARNYQDACTAITYNDLVSHYNTYLNEDIQLSSCKVTNVTKSSETIRLWAEANGNEKYSLDCSQFTFDMPLANGNIKVGDTITIWGRLADFQYIGMPGKPVDEKNINVAIIDAKYILVN